MATISVVACNAGRNTEDSGLTTGSANSFASQFHKVLWKKYSIKTVVYARVYAVATFEEGQFKGRKVTALDNEDRGIRHREKSKKKFYWQNGKQVEEWVTYAASDSQGSNSDI